MSQNKIINLKKPEKISEDSLIGMLRIEVKKLITDAVEAELHEYLY